MFISLPGKVGTSIIVTIQNLRSSFFCDVVSHSRRMKISTALLQKPQNTNKQTLYQILLGLKVTIMIWHNIYNYVLIFR